MRQMIAVMCVFACSASFAAEINGKVRTVDVDKSTLTVQVDGMDKSLNVSKEADIFSMEKGKKGKGETKVALPGGLANIKEGSQVTVTTAGKVVTSIKVESEPKSADKAKSDKKKKKKNADADKAKKMSDKKAKSTKKAKKAEAKKKPDTKKKSKKADSKKPDAKKKKSKTADAK